MFGSNSKFPGDYFLNDSEGILIKTAFNAFHAPNKKVVVVLNTGGVIDMAAWRDDADAILMAWQPVLEGCSAITDIFNGKVNPSGKLATTFAEDYKDLPPAKSFPDKEFPEHAVTGIIGMKQIPAEVTYEENIYVGYRYCYTFNVKSAYEFGYGLSYTNFTYSNLTLSSASFNGKLTVTITVTNSGKVAGKEVVQLYISASPNKLEKPSEELKAFAKNEWLLPDKNQTIKFTINANDLVSFDTNTTSWIAEPGGYTRKSRHHLLT